MESISDDLSDEEMAIKEEREVDYDLYNASFPSRRLSEACSDTRGSSNSPTDDIDDDNIVIIRMDIKEPLCTIKTILQEKFPDVSEYKFTLQDSEELDDQTNLLDHCLQGEGLVQINLELKDDDRGKRLDIIDVLKPDEDDDDYYPEDDEDTYENHRENVKEENDEKRREKVKEEKNIDESERPIPLQNDVPAAVVPEKRIPAKRGKRKASEEKEKKIAPTNAAKKVCGRINNSIYKTTKITTGEVILPEVKRTKTRKRKPVAKVVDRKVKKPSTVRTIKPKTPSNVVRNTKSLSTSQSLQIGQPSSSSIQLWQFLLELLTDYHHRDSIQWLNREGEFELIDPEMVAKLWGIKKNKPQMNYENLSRALRFYYDGDMLSKVPGKKFVYKFICDLKFLIGYTAKELHDFVTEAEALAKHNSIHYLSEYPKSPPSSPEVIIQQGVVLPSNYVAD